MRDLTSTQAKIHAAALRHFLRDGFQKASLRKIVAEAGYTLGAFYGYYRSKEELFDALVAETAEGIDSILSRMGDEAENLPPEKRMGSMTTVFAHGLPELLDYLLGHPDETRLLLKCSEGTRYENFLEGHMERNLSFARGVSEGNFPLHPLAAKLLVRSYFSLFGDAALSGEPRGDIMQAMQDIEDLFAGGMIYLWKGRPKV
ncbi:MAG: TetR/AcrR family transcriptional regulator [Oscillospiraceae bacterium]|nr:TetR/AcrR family transcriptional regulator [Oscillospiraceae bacterium]